MIDRGKLNLLGILVDGVDYGAATERVIRAAEEGTPYAVSALAVHGVMEGVADPELAYRLNRLDLVTADGQPVRWALNLLHRAALPDRCYGPTLMREVCVQAAERDLPVFLYGSRPSVLEPLANGLRTMAPGLVIAGSSPSRFGRVDSLELDRIGARIRDSGARLVFAGLGCPRQEIFAYEMRDRVGMPVLAVGAAFDYHAGLLEEPPAWVQRAGLQWMWRLAAEPQRLLGRYLRTNPSYVAGVALQAVRRQPPSAPERAPEAECGYA